MQTYKIGDVLGNNRYELKRELGRGTYGVVWEAHDNSLDATVAIKTIHKHQGGVRELQHEALTQARLSHPHIATIYDVSLDEAFIAMEYIDGETLEKKLKDLARAGEWIDAERALNVLDECFDAMTYAHSQGVVHGDIKPGNIMVRNDGHIKVTDFGVAKLLIESTPPRYENEPRRLGSTTYMAPETARGAPRDKRSDVFSLGVLAYLLLTGHHPFYNTHASGLFTIRDELLTEREAASLRDIDPRIPIAYNQVVMRMIAKSAEARYAEARDAYQDLVGVKLVCQECSAPNELSAKFCNQCGAILQAAMDEQFRSMTPEQMQAKAYQLNSLERYDEAIRFCDEALRLDPKLSSAYHTRGYSRACTGQYDDALADYGLALQHATTDRHRSQIHQFIGYVYFKQHQIDRMIAELREARRLDPTNAKAMFLLDKFTNPQKDDDDALTSSPPAGKAPAVSVRQQVIQADENSQRGLLVVEILRPVFNAVGTGKLTPHMRAVPEVTVSLRSHPEGLDMSAFKCSTGVGTTHDFHIGLKSTAFGVTLATGEYEFDYSVQITDGQAQNGASPQQEGMNGGGAASTTCAPPIADQGPTSDDVAL